MQSLLDKYKSNIANEIRQIEENRRQFLLDYKLYQISQNEGMSEAPQAVVNFNEIDGELKQANGNKTTLVETSYEDEEPCIVYSLQDYEILEDWSIIKMHNDISRTISTEC